MRTIGYRWPRNAPRGDFCVHCDYCGSRWRRSQCVRDRSGRLACPQDQGGRDERTLDELNVASGRERAKLPPKETGGFYPALQAYTGDDDQLGLTQRTTAEDI